MEIEYNKFDFDVEFHEEIFTERYPAFVLRSVLGNELKKFACILKHKTCETCPLKFQCAYSFIFETPIKKENQILMGRDKATHPFTISSMEDINKKLKKLSFSLSLFGRGIEYFPYIYYSFMKAGENGMFRKRSPYKIVRIVSDDFIVNDGSQEDLNILERKVWALDREFRISKKAIKIDFLTPVRMKIDGKYTSNIEYEDIIFSAFNKAKVMTKMYGKYNRTYIEDSRIKPKTVKKYLVWKDYKRYSSRQRTEMFLGGNTGHMIIDGEFSDFEISILKSAEIFGLGKNTSFGFGVVKLSEL